MRFFMVLMLLGMGLIGAVAVAASALGLLGVDLGYRWLNAIAGGGIWQSISTLMFGIGGVMIAWLQIPIWWTVGTEHRD